MKRGRFQNSFTCGWALGTLSHTESGAVGTPVVGSQPKPLFPFNLYSPGRKHTCRQERIILVCSGKVSLYRSLY
ncbi:hypothetical protein PF008_g16369 [Phytophthora fragariae]|uniref:Uncharacterized protein n=1 Tax=Phytophthora fragariae TaxID=53985 RepID=A0A6G0RBC8_9STRA|nr:hypothetical protein PF008_g16369 [Phytophthora fragariae]